MYKNFPPNTDPNLFSMYAILVAFAIVDDFNAYEINSIGNWIILLGQYLLTVAAQQQLIENRIDNRNININSKQAKNGGSVYENGKSNQSTRLEVEFLLEAFQKMSKEIEYIKNNLEK